MAHSLLNDIEIQLGAISVAEALVMLHDLKCETESIVVTDTQGNYLTTPWRLAAKYANDYPAAGVGPFTFSGGPPGQPYWYTGSLLTLVIDRHLRRIAQHKIKTDASEMFYYYERNRIRVRVRG